MNAPAATAPLMTGDDYRESLRRYRPRVFVDGRRVKHYALTDQKEFFAEMSEAYFGTNDFYPFVRGELMQHDPRAHAILEKSAHHVPDRIERRVCRAAVARHRGATRARLALGSFSHGSLSKIGRAHV